MIKYFHDNMHLVLILSEKSKATKIYSKLNKCVGMQYSLNKVQKQKLKCISDWVEK